MTCSSYSVDLLSKRASLNGIADFVLNVFMNDVSPLYSAEGIGSFKSYVSKSAVSARRRNGAFWIIAHHRNDLVGALEIRSDAHLSLLFVHPNWRRMGIAHALFFRALECIRALSTGIKELTVNATPNATSFYESLGFRPVAPEQVSAGIKFVPMRMVLDNALNNGKVVPDEESHWHYRRTETDRR